MSYYFNSLLLFCCCYAPWCMCERQEKICCFFWQNTEFDSAVSGKKFCFWKNSGKNSVLFGKTGKYFFLSFSRKKTAYFTKKFFFHTCTIVVMSLFCYTFISKHTNTNRIRAHCDRFVLKSDPTGYLVGTLTKGTCI